MQMNANTRMLCKWYAYANAYYAVLLWGKAGWCVHAEEWKCNAMLSLANVGRPDDKGAIR